MNDLERLGWLYLRGTLDELNPEEAVMLCSAVAEARRRSEDLGLSSVAEFWRAVYLLLGGVFCRFAPDPVTLAEARRVLNEAREQAGLGKAN